MDKRAEQVINSINREAIDRFKTTTKTEKNIYVERAKEVLNTKSVPNDVKKNISRLLDNGSFGKDKTSEDKTKTRGIKEFIDTKIDSAIKNGRMPAPDIKEYNNFIKRNS